MPYKTRMEFDGECYKHEQYIPVLDRSPDGSSTVLEILFNRYKKRKMVKYMVQSLKEKYFGELHKKY